MANEINHDFKKILETAKKNVELFSTIDIDKLLESINKEKNDYLNNKRIQDLKDEVYESISELKITKKQVKIICDKLSEYRLVYRICDLHKGKHVRWIRTYGLCSDSNLLLTNGGIVVDIKFTDSGINILCRNYMNRFINYNFNDCITFQKLSTDEQLILINRFI